MTRVDLLAQERSAETPSDGGAPSDITPGERPFDRPDALARSRHSRLDATAGSFGDPTAGRADPRIVCAEICRALLGDLAPALILLGPRERRRAQAVGAFTYTLFDFARQHGVEGERLSEINRWEFTLEAALDGSAAEALAGQPIFTRLAEEHRDRPFDLDGFDDLTSAARLRAVMPRRSGPASRAEEIEERIGLLLADGLVRLLIGPSTSNELRRHLRTTVQRAVSSRLGGGGSVPPLPAALRAEVPRPYRRALHYLAAATRELDRRSSSQDADPSRHPSARLSAVRRLRYLLAAGLAG